MLNDNKDWFLAITRSMSLWHQCHSVSGCIQDMGYFGVNAQVEQVSVTDKIYTTIFNYNKDYSR